MIEEPALLTIKRPSRRPTEKQIAALQGVPTSFVVDAMFGGHTMDRAIRPLVHDPAVSVAGPALTVDSGPADVLAVIAAMKFVQTGDVVVNFAHGHQGCAAMGDRVAGFAKNSGAAAMITDGLARDYAGLVDVGLPVWCTGLSPNSPFGKGPGRIGFPVVLGGQHIETGDMIVADFDGCVVVPFDDIDDVLAKLDTIKELETSLDAEVKVGLKLPAAVEELLLSDQISYQDD